MAHTRRNFGISSGLPPGRCVAFSEWQSYPALWFIEAGAVVSEIFNDETVESRAGSFCKRTFYAMRTMTCFLVLSGSLLMQSGCGKEPKGPPRDATYPITGLITVDGKPEAQVQVKCHPVGGANDLPSAAMTDADGKFSVGTYESGDGAPPGEYKLTFMWGQINLVSGRYGPPDKLNKRYSNVEQSEYSVTVKEGEQCDTGLIPLTTK